MTENALSSFFEFFAAQTSILHSSYDTRYEPDALGQARATCSERDIARYAHDTR